MYLELGTDIIAISRIKNALTRFGINFLQRFLLSSEILLTCKQRKLHSLNTAIREVAPARDFTSSIPQFFTHDSIDVYVCEADDFHLDSYKIETIAGFWAIKEACAKALGVGIGKDIGFHDMCIFKDSHGKPHLALHESKWNIFKTQKISISMSHDTQSAIAICAIIFYDV